MLQFDELELNPPKRSVIGMIFAPPDYRTEAIGSLIKESAIQKAEDGKLYLSEEDLATSKWKEL